MRPASAIRAAALRDVSEGCPVARTAEFEASALVHLDALYRTAVRLTGDRVRAEDLVQDTYLRAFRSFSRFEPGTDCRAWLFTILRRIFLNGLRRRDRERLGECADSVEATAAAPVDETPEAEYLRRALSADVERALKALPLVFREAVILVDLEGLSYRETAAILACPIGTVMSRLSRARGLLRRALGDDPRTLCTAAASESA